MLNVKFLFFAYHGFYIFIPSKVKQRHLRVLGEIVRSFKDMHWHALNSGKRILSLSRTENMCTCACIQLKLLFVFSLPWPTCVYNIFKKRGSRLSPLLWSRQNVYNLAVFALIYKVEGIYTILHLLPSLWRRQVIDYFALITPFCGEERMFIILHSWPFFWNRQELTVLHCSPLLWSRDDVHNFAFFTLVVT
jgi:hypothetical protein